MTFTVAEIGRRSNVWIALSELFVDNELSTIDKTRLAEKLKESGYQLVEIQNILEDEVLPTFSINLMAVTGNWSGWSDEEVQQRVIKRLSAGVNSSMKWWRRLCIKFLVGQDWQEIKKILQSTR
jgi:hypothetical protein